MEWLQANWLWLLLGLGVVWFFLRGCAMGGHGSHRSGDRRDTTGDSRAGPGAQDGGPHDGHRREEETTAPRGGHRHRGGC